MRSTVKKKKKKKKARPSTGRAAALADKSKSPIKCRKSLCDLKQVQVKGQVKQKRREVHACGCNRFIADIQVEGAK